MKQITINIPESRYSFFMELLKNFDFIQIDESPYNAEFVAKVQQSEKEFEEGNFTTVKKENLKNFLNL